MPVVTSKGRQSGDGSADPVSKQSLSEVHPDQLVWTSFILSVTLSVDRSDTAQPRPQLPMPQLLPQDRRGVCSG